MTEPHWKLRSGMNSTITYPSPFPSLSEPEVKSKQDSHELITQSSRTPFLSFFFFIPQPFCSVFVHRFCGSGLCVLDHAYSWLDARLGLFVLYFVLCPVGLLCHLPAHWVCCAFFHWLSWCFALLLILNILYCTSHILDIYTHTDASFSIDHTQE